MTVVTVLQLTHKMVMYRIYHYDPSGIFMLTLIKTFTTKENQTIPNIN